MIGVLCTIGDPHACMEAAPADRAGRRRVNGALGDDAGEQHGHAQFRSPPGLGSGDPRAYPYGL